jgi:hypothetical protein
MIAIDTNVLIYACDQADPRRQKIASTSSRLSKGCRFPERLGDQSTASGDFYVDSSAPVSGDFNLYGAGGLSPFSASSKCCEMACRAKGGSRFHRLVKSVVSQTIGHDSQDQVPCRN